MGHWYGLGKEWEFSYDGIGWVGYYASGIYPLEAMDGLEVFLRAFGETRWLPYDFMIKSCVVHGILMKGVLCI